MKYQIICLLLPTYYFSSFEFRLLRTNSNLPSVFFVDVFEHYLFHRVKSKLLVALRLVYN
jgi:hypothetical protein